MAHTKPLLLDRLRELQQQPLALSPEATDQVYIDTDTAPVLAALGRLYVPMFPAVAVALCKVEGLENFNVGCEAESVVLLNNADNERVMLPMDADGIVVVEAAAADGNGVHLICR